MTKEICVFSKEADFFIISNCSVISVSDFFSISRYIISADSGNDEIKKYPVKAVLS